MKKVLNVGGNSKLISLPKEYEEFEHLLLDIDPVGKPDILCDSRELIKLDPEQFDMIYCSHNLEHYYEHDVKKVLTGFMHVLINGGGVHLIVPDMEEVFKTMVENKMDLEDNLYQSALGPIRVLDVIYGYSKQIEQSQVDFFAHKTGFTSKSLFRKMHEAGFKNIHGIKEGFNLVMIGFKGVPKTELMEKFRLKASK
jgi:ubiquinone/menaquinone biosynthesis C-methylase UbiE